MLAWGNFEGEGAGEGVPCGVCGVPDFVGVEGVGGGVDGCWPATGFFREAWSTVNLIADAAACVLR